MIDLSSVSMHGVANHARVRVLWRDGLLRAFSVDGLVLELKTKEPRRIKGHLWRWQADNDIGPLTMKGKCIACGGSKWWRVLRIPSKELWRKEM